MAASMSGAQPHEATLQQSLCTPACSQLLLYSGTAIQVGKTLATGVANGHGPPPLPALRYRTGCKAGSAIFLVSARPHPALFLSECVPASAYRALCNNACLLCRRHPGPEPPSALNAASDVCRQAEPPLTGRNSWPVVPRAIGASLWRARRRMESTRSVGRGLLAPHKPANA